MNSLPGDVDGAVPGEVVGSQPPKLRGWVRIGSDGSPGVVLEQVHGEERVLQPQVVLRPAPLNTSPLSAEKVPTHPGVGSNELCDGGVPGLVGSQRANQYVTELLARRRVVHHDTGLHGCQLWAKLTREKQRTWSEIALEVCSTGGASEGGVPVDPGAR